MQPLKSGKFFILFLVLCCFQSRAQEVINTVGIQKVNASLYKVQYKLNSTTDYDVETVVLKIFRRRGGKVEELFSRNIISESSRLQNSVFSYNWKPASGDVKSGDELQAKIVLSYKPSLAKQKSKQPNKSPYADAGNSLEVELPVNKLIVLNGGKSNDEDGKIVSAQWKQIAGPSTVTIQKKDSLIAYVNGDIKEGTYAFELSVKDDQGATAISRTILSVKSAPFVINTNPVITPAPKKDSTVVRKTVPSTQAVIPVKTVTKLHGGPSNAALNLFVPGLGHYFVSGDYNGQNRKSSAFILTAIYAASAGGAYYFYQKSNSEYKKYNELADFKEYQKDINGVIIGIRGGNEAEANNYLKKGKAARRNSLICLGVGGGVLVGDLIYTLVKGSKNKTDWKNENTTFKPKLFISSDGLVTNAGVQFKF
jgi:hypothetical protein